MKILVTGAAGFLGSRLIAALLSGRQGLPITRIVAADTSPFPNNDTRVDCRTGTITEADFITSIVGRDVDATRSLLEACRRLKKAPRFVFASSIAVFGGPLPDVVPEDMVVLPHSSYGAEKAIAELLVNEYSRRGFIDGIVCRLPTIAVRS